MQWLQLHHVSKIDSYLIFYKLKKPETIFTIFGTQYPDNLLTAFKIFATNPRLLT